MTMVATTGRRQVAFAVSSSGSTVGNRAGIVIDGWLVPVPTQWDGSGYYVVALDPLTGDQQTATFDLVALAESADTLAAFVSSVPPRFLLTAAIKGDGQTNLNETAITAFEHIGARQLRQLAFRDSWAFATIVGFPDRLLQEQRSSTASVQIQSTVELRGPVPFVPPRPDDRRLISISSTSQLQIQADNVVFVGGATAEPDGIHVVQVDPSTWTMLDHRKFPFADPNGWNSIAAALSAYVATIPPGPLVLVGTQGHGPADPPAELYQTLAKLGGWKFQMSPPISWFGGYSLVGRVGALPGSMVDSVIGPTSILNVNVDSQPGTWFLARWPCSRTARATTPTLRRSWSQARRRTSTSPPGTRRSSLRQAPP